MRIAFCVQRYGAEVAGGAEALCRRTARALVEAGDEVVVHTTTARDYLSWAAHYPVGVTVEDGVEVHRHGVEAADPALAADLVRALSLRPGDPGEESRWVRAQGPVSPGLLTALAGAGRHHEVVVFWTYLYAHAQLGLPLCRDRAVLVPLAHDEPMLRFTVSRGLTRAAAGLAFMTPEEALLVDDLHGVGDRPAAIVGAGVDPPTDPPAGERTIPGSGARGGAAAAGPAGLPDRYVLYLGRVDPAKGVLGLVRDHAAYRRAGGRLGLVLAGRETVPLALPDWVVRTGFVGDRERLALLRGAEVVALPSRYESLSLVALEAWQAGRPTLGTAACEVVAGQTRRSGGGLVYAGREGYVHALRGLEEDPARGRALGAAGARWVAGLTWDAAVRRWRALLARVRRPLER